MVLQAKSVYVYMENKDIKSDYLLPDAIKSPLTPPHLDLDYPDRGIEGILPCIQPVRAWSRQSIELTTAIHEMRGTSQKYR